MFKIEIFVWENNGLKLFKFNKESARDAMDFAYGYAGWNVMKIYDPDGDLIHSNSTSKEVETYA